MKLNMVKWKTINCMQKFTFAQTERRDEFCLHSELKVIIMDKIHYLGYQVSRVFISTYICILKVISSSHPLRLSILLIRIM